MILFIIYFVGVVISFFWHFMLVDDNKNHFYKSLKHSGLFLYNVLSLFTSQYKQKKELLLTGISSFQIKYSEGHKMYYFNIRNKDFKIILINKNSLLCKI